MEGKFSCLFWCYFFFCKVWEKISFHPKVSLIFIFNVPLASIKSKEGSRGRWNSNMMAKIEHKIWGTKNLNSSAGSLLFSHIFCWDHQQIRIPPQKSIQNSQMWDEGVKKIKFKAATGSDYNKKFHVVVALLCSFFSVVVEDQKSFARSTAILGKEKDGNFSPTWAGKMKNVNNRHADISKSFLNKENFPRSDKSSEYFRYVFNNNVTSFGWCSPMLIFVFPVLN